MEAGIEAEVEVKKEVEAQTEVEVVAQIEVEVGVETEVLEVEVLNPTGQIEAEEAGVAAEVRNRTEAEADRLGPIKVRVPEVVQERGGLLRRNLENSLILTVKLRTNRVRILAGTKNCF